MIVLDTHALVFYAGRPDDLSARARRRIDEEVAAGTAWFSSISVWEVAMLVRRGRLELSVGVEDWVAGVETIPGLTALAVTNPIALRAVALPEEYPSDPADRLIAATALLLGAELVTKDRRLREIPELPTVW